MIFNLAVIALTGFIAYMWFNQGLFSGFLHMVCTLVAGGVALAVWEPLAMILVNQGGLLQSIAWTVSLVGPFIVTLVLLRMASDKFIPGNLDFDNLTNMIGGAVTGAISGVVTVGVLVLGIGFLGLPSSFLGHEPMKNDPQGNVIQGSSLWLPADKITVKLYEHLSGGAFGSSSSLASRHPDLHEQAGVLRMTWEDKSRATLARSDFKVTHQYSVHEAGMSALLDDSFAITSNGESIGPQSARATSGNVYPSPSNLHGYIVEFSAGAKEKKGQIVVGPGQIRLVGVDREGRPFARHPVAFLTQPKGDTPTYHRFRFDAEDIYLASPQGKSRVTAGFEFVVPEGATLTDLIVKNVRADVTRVPDVSEQPEGGYTVAQRDDAVRNRSIFGLEAIALDTSDAKQVNLSGSSRLSTDGIAASSNLKVAFNRQNRGSLDVNADNKVQGGTHKFSRSAMSTNVPQSLRVSQFHVPPQSKMVQVNVGEQSKFSLLGKAQQAGLNVLPPVLIDSNGQQYEAIGWIFEDGPNIEYRYTPGQPIRGLEQIPNLSLSREDRDVTLLFIVPQRITLTAFALGNRVQQSFELEIR